jgi:transcriptional antiterminator NusG
MSDEEIAQWISLPGAEEVVAQPSARPQFNVGDQVEIVDGPFTGFKGVVLEIDLERGFLRVEIQVFSRATPMELEFWQVEKYVE